MSSTATTYTVVGYNGCGYAEHACSTVKKLAASHENISYACQMSSRAEYKAWLRSGKGLASGVPASHTSSPACFKDSTFLGGCDDLMNHVGTTYGNNAVGNNGGCAVQ